ncbi:MAG: nucleotidyltransferase domain-containing protein [Flavobacteriales bacterium]|nr:nucleotidyltransferase domain-containing protein [Flavobacteriales bacterium]
METEILNKLKSIEQEKHVEILFAVESGSRAWGFASPDSDYDVRFVFKRKTDDYLGLWEKRDTIEFFTDLDLDGSGWDLKKATILLSRSNASFLGWLFSPIVYRSRGETLEKMRELANSNFNPVAGFYHYHSMNKNFAEQVESGSFTLKSYFYAIRTALCANWIMKMETVPPVEFRQLYPLIEEDIAMELDRLIALKAQTIESGKTSVDLRLIETLQAIVIENESMKDSLASVKPDSEAFNQFFLNEIK